MPVTQTRSTEEVEALIQIALAIPVHRFLSLELVSWEPGAARLRMQVGLNAATPANTLHGGVFSLVLEMAAYAALLPVIPADKTPTTIDFHNQPMRAVMFGQTLDIRGRVLRHGRRQAFCEVETFVAGKLVGKAQILKALLDSGA
jgi:uncharacterized protein (TIGR00369 family)